MKIKTILFLFFINTLLFAHTPQEVICHLYLVHHGDTAWTEEKRLQGWIDIPLNDHGKAQMEALAQKLSPLKVDAIYSSDLTRAVESAQILQKTWDAPIIIDSALRGESHGNLEGLQKSVYQNDPHYIAYKALSPEKQIFTPVGAGGLSKADVGRVAVPKLQEICRKHPGQTVLVVTHGGVLEFLTFFLGQREKIPHGQWLCIDGTGLYLAPKELPDSYRLSPE